jgi:DNA-binding NarL/FixJ family response regulator
VIEATDTTTAIGLAQNTTLHTIIIDIDIPRKNGFEALRRIRTTAPDVQIVAFGLDETEVRRIAVIEAGATAYLPKSRIQTELIPTLKVAFGITNDVSRVTSKECDQVR